MQDENEAVFDNEETEETTGWQEKYQEMQDRYTRSLAEFDNYRKRTAKEMAVRYDDGVRGACEKLLPILDNFERALAANPDKGINLISRQFEGVLTELGVTQIEVAPGTPFNANEFYAVAHGEDENFGTSEVAEVLQKGYKHGNKIIRPAMVKVVN